MNSRTVVCAVALAATVFVGQDALAGRRAQRKRTRTVEMTRPADSPDPDATGTVTITAGAQGRTVLHLRHLDANATYEIRDSASGDLLGDATTNARGRANFNLTVSLAKAESVDGSDGGDVQSVDVVDGSTGDEVLTGDVDPPEQPPAFGYDSYENDAGDFADVTMSTDGQGDDTFYLDLYPVQDPASGKYDYYDFWRDTAAGDSLPLDVSSVADLAGRQFQIVTAADGTVVIDGTLPDLETYDCPAPGDDWSDWGDWGDGGNVWDGGWSGDWSGDWTGDWGGDRGSGDWSGDWGGDWSGDASGDGTATLDRNFLEKRTRRHHHRRHGDRKSVV